jgi:outer membrane biogenesis lipoprotein LolB
MRVKSNHPYKVLVWVAVGLLALALACSSPSSADAQVALCSNLTTFQQSVEELTNLDSYSTMGEVKAAANMARHSFDAVEQANAEVKNAQVEALRNNYEDLQVAIAALPDDATVEDAKASLQPQIAAVQAAREEVSSRVECP